MRHVQLPQPKRPVEIDGQLLDDAASLSIDAAAVVESALRREIATERARRWREENAEAIGRYNAKIEADGLWCDDHRLF